MKKPKITVLMPVYNAEKFLREAIDSILNQTFKDFEFLIINDASTDNSKKIILSYEDPRIIYAENKKNLGVTKTLNRGLKLTKAKYIARMDADDISLPERFEKQVEFMDKNQNLGLLGSSWILIDEAGKKKQFCKAYKGRQAVHFMCHGSVMMRKKVLEKVGYYRKIFKYAQDYDLWLRFSENYEMTNLEEPLYKLRAHRNSVSSTKNEEQDLYAALALKMAEERQGNQKDSLTANEKEALKIVESELNLSPLKKKLLFSKSYFIWAKAANDLGNSSTAINYLKKSFDLIPWNFQTWILLIKILINKFRKEIL